MIHLLVVISLHVQAVAHLEEHDSDKNNDDDNSDDDALPHLAPLEQVLSTIVTAPPSPSQTKPGPTGPRLKVTQHCQPSTLVREGQEVLELEKQVGPMLAHLTHF